MKETTENETIKKVLEGQSLTPQPRLSPSSIIEYNRCPRCYFYRYIAKIKTRPNVHLIKGIIVHKVLENFFRGYKSDMDSHVIALFNKAWLSNEKNIRDLEMPPEEIVKARNDCLTMITEYLANIKRKMKNLRDCGKAENDGHAYYLLKPKFRERFFEDKDLHLCGFVDRIHEDFDGLITIGDYKTSSKYGIGLPEHYKLQLALYSLLYKLSEQKTPDFAAVIFLRYGEEYLLEVTPSLLRYALDTARTIYEKTRSTKMEDYPAAVGQSSRWCPYIGIHDGTDEWKESLRREKMKHIIEEEEKK